MITKDQILTDLNSIHKSDSYFDLLVNTLVHYLIKTSNDITFSEYILTKNRFTILIVKKETYNLQIELTHDFIQIQFYDNTELLIYFENDLIVKNVKKIISSFMNGDYEIENYLDSLNRIISKKLIWNDETLQKYNTEYVVKLFHKEFSKIKKHKGLSLIKPPLCEV